jgi:hypothetical protein
VSILSQWHGASSGCRWRKRRLGDSDGSCEYGSVSRFPNWSPGARTANDTALCHWVQLYRYLVSQSSEFCRHNPLCCFSTSVCCCCLFRYRLSPETFGYTLVRSIRSCRQPTSCDPPIGNLSGKGPITPHRKQNHNSKKRYIQLGTRRIFWAIYVTKNYTRSEWKGG